MNNIVNFFSLCCPCTNYHALKDFDKLNSKEKVFISTITTVIALVTLPLFGCLAILAFRQLVRKFSAKEIHVKQTEENDLQKTSLKVQEQTIKNFPQQNLQQEIKQRLQIKNFSLPIVQKKPADPAKIVLSQEKLESLNAVQATPLIHAIVTNDLARVKRITLNSPLAKVADKRGCLPIHWAAQEGKLEILQFLISYNHVDALGHQNRTALSYAAQAGNENIVNFLLASKANASLADQNGNLPIHWAASTGHLNILKSLLAHSDVNAKISTGNTILGIAAANGKTDIVEFLLTQKADANLADDGGSLPLHWAAGYGFTEIVRQLIKATVDINTKSKTGNTALSVAVAAEVEQKEMVEILLANGANANSADNLNSLPIHHASLHGYLEIVRLLLAYKSEINALDNWGRTPLRLAAEFGKNPELIAFLIKHGANPNLPDKNKIYPLDSAIKEGFPEIVKILEPITQKEKNSKQVPIEDEDLNWDFEETADEKKPALSKDLQNAIKDLIEFSDDEEPSRPQEIQNALNELLAFDDDWDEENSSEPLNSKIENKSLSLLLNPHQFTGLKIDEEDDF